LPLCACRSSTATEADPVGLFTCQIFMSIAPLSKSSQSSVPAVMQTDGPPSLVPASAPPTPPPAPADPPPPVAGAPAPPPAALLEATELVLAPPEPDMVVPIAPPELEAVEVPEVEEVVAGWADESSPRVPHEPARATSASAAEIDQGAMAVGQ